MLLFYGLASASNLNSIEVFVFYALYTFEKGKLVKNTGVYTMQAISACYFIMENLFSALDTLLDLPLPAFEKKLTKFEEDFKDASVSDVSEEELEAYFSRIKDEYEESK